MCSYDSNKDSTIARIVDLSICTTRPRAIPLEQYSSPSTGSTDQALESPAGALQFLVERARDFVLANGGSVAEDLLIRHVFGTTKSPAVWTSLFRTVVDQGPDLRRRWDGQWTVAGLGSSEGILLGDFVAVDVETTGLKPVTHRVIEIGMARYCGGQLADRYSQLVDPSRRLPQYITKLTGIRDADFEGAPTFADVAPDVEAFIGDDMIVGHNVEFDIRFLSAELKRAGRQTIVNDRLDTMSLSTALLRDIRRPSLDKIAKTLGLAPRKLHRALDDAELTSRCALLLLEIARDQGISSVDELRCGVPRAPSRPRDGVGRARALIDREHLDGIPKSPGVYIMRDAAGRIIYIGKAKNLRDRVASYYAEPLGYTRKMDGLAEAIASIDVEQTGTELEALLLEAQLIRRYQPRYNSALKAHENYPYIRVTMSSPWPRICLARKPAANGDRYFGPYRNGNAARRAVALLNSTMPLRTCTRSFKTPASLGAPCLRLDLGQCLGPCVGRANRGTYLAAIDAALRFLDGDDDALIAELHNQLETSAERQDFERARRLRNGINTLQAVATAGRRRTSDAFRSHLVVILPSHDEQSVGVSIVAGGRIWATVRASRDGDSEEFAERVSRAYERLLEHGTLAIDCTTIDDTAVITRWLEQHDGHPCILSKPPERGWDWAEIASTAFTITYREFVSWSPPDEGEDIVLDISTDPERPGNLEAGDVVLAIQATSQSAAEMTSGV